jgi:hypothetical protein
MKTYGGGWSHISTILDLVTRWTEWSASSTGRFTPGVIAPGTYWIGVAIVDATIKIIYETFVLLGIQFVTFH